jgi:hypothetical protein
MNNNIEPSRGGKTEFRRINTSETQFFPSFGRIGLFSTVDGSLELSKAYQTRCDFCVVFHADEK